MVTPLRPMYVLYSYMEPLGNTSNRDCPGACSDAEGLNLDPTRLKYNKDTPIDPKAKHPVSFELKHRTTTLTPKSAMSLESCYNACQAA